MKWTLVKWFLTGACQNHIFKANSFSNLTMHGGWTLGTVRLSCNSLLSSPANLWRKVKVFFINFIIDITYMSNSSSLFLTTSSFERPLLTLWSKSVTACAREWRLLVGHDGGEWRTGGQCTHVVHLRSLPYLKPLWDSWSLYPWSKQKRPVCHGLS